MRIRFIDGLKGLAAFLVVCHHFSLAFYPATYTRSAAEMHLPGGLETLIYSTPLNIIINGNFAVVLFLMISGFVLSLKYLETYQLAILSATAVKRFFRLLPPILVMNMGVWIILRLGWTFNLQAAPMTLSPWWLGNNWIVTPDFWLMLKQSLWEVFFRILPPHEIYNSSLWVIPIFFLGTFLVTGFLALFGRLPKRAFVYGIVILSLLATYYYPLLIGVALADLYIHRPTWFTTRYHQVTGGLLLGLGILTASYPTEHNQGQVASTLYAFFPDLKIGDTVVMYHALGATCIILSIFLLPRLQKWLTHEALVFLGSISYSLYVSHVVVLLLVGSGLLLLLTPEFSYNQACLLMLLITLPLIIGVATLLHRLVELPGIRWSNRIWEWCTQEFQLDR